MPEERQRLDPARRQGVAAVEPGDPPGPRRGRPGPGPAGRRRPDGREPRPRPPRPPSCARTGSSTWSSRAAARRSSGPWPSSRPSPSSSTTRASATSTSTNWPTSTWPRRSASTPRSSGPAPATPWRRCSSTRTWPPGSCRASAAQLAEAGVEIRGCERTRRFWPAAKPATEDDWYAEYLDLILAVRVVDDVQRGDRPHRPVRVEPHRRDRLRGHPPHPAVRPRRRFLQRHGQHHRPASPTAASTAWAPRSASRPTNSTPAAPWACGT